MESSHRTVMQKDTLVKEDGRRLIYYRFVPERDEHPLEESPVSVDRKEA